MNRRTNEITLVNRLTRSEVDFVHFDSIVSINFLCDFFQQFNQTNCFRNVLEILTIASSQSLVLS